VGARPNPSPVFILGHQKSGTSAIAALLAELTGRSVAVDLFNENRKPMLPRVAAGQASFDRFLRRNRLDFSRDIVKDPTLTFFHPQLAQRFPGASFAMVVRDPRANVKSVLDRLGLPGDRDDLSAAQLEALPLGWRLVFDPSWLGLPPATYIELLAARVARCADTYLDSPGSFRLVRYEDFLAGKLGTLEGLAGDLGLECRHDIGDRLDVQFQPAGNRSVSVRQCFGEENLARIDRICGEQMRRLGYSPAVVPGDERPLEPAR